MLSSDFIGLWSTGLWIDLGSPAGISALTISGYACQPNTIGRLNTYISACYSGSGYTGAGSVNYDVTPQLFDAEMAIIGAMYSTSYFSSLSQATMGAGGTTIPFLSLREGDSVITQVNAASIGKVYMDMSIEANKVLRQLVNQYVENIQNSNVPRGVSYYSILGPIWSQSYVQP
jgi:hypothetical protein